MSKNKTKKNKDEPILTKLVEIEDKSTREGRLSYKTNVPGNNHTNIVFMGKGTNPSNMLFNKEYVRINNKYDILIEDLNKYVELKKDNRSKDLNLNAFISVFSNYSKYSSLELREIFNLWKRKNLNEEKSTKMKGLKINK